MIGARKKHSFSSSNHIRHIRPGKLRAIGLSDLQSEIHRSKVFSPATKHRLIDIFTKFMDLLMILTEVLPVALPFEAELEAGPGYTKDEDNKILKCREQLANWYE
jgi:hypothetical protein